MNKFSGIIKQGGLSSEDNSRPGSPPMNVISSQIPKSGSNK